MAKNNYEQIANKLTSVAKGISEKKNVRVFIIRVYEITQKMLS